MADVGLLREDGEAASAVAPPQEPYSLEEKFGLSFVLKNHLSFGLRFPTVRKCLKSGRLDMSQNQNGISSRFAGQKIFY